ncbi:MAG: hypothetical protein QG629_704 [Patescibacteria group bacterium]|nr:hypothetical protein [Patescibacteria group bacterium]
MVFWSYDKNIAVGDFYPEIGQGGFGVWALLLDVCIIFPEHTQCW